MIVYVQLYAYATVSTNEEKKNNNLKFVSHLNQNVSKTNPLNKSESIRFHLFVFYVASRNLWPRCNDAFMQKYPIFEETNKNKKHFSHNHRVCYDAVYLWTKDFNAQHNELRMITTKQGMKNRLWKKERKERKQKWCVFYIHSTATGFIVCISLLIHTSLQFIHNRWC